MLTDSLLFTSWSNNIMLTLILQVTDKSNNSMVTLRLQVVEGSNNTMATFSSNNLLSPLTLKLTVIQITHYVNSNLTKY